MLAACGEPRSPAAVGSTGGDGAETSGGSGDEIATTITTTTTADGSTSSDGSTTSDGVKLDVGAPGDTTDAPLDGCQGIDVLFVIDNSNSMFGHQQQLAESVPGFITAIVDEAPTDDVRVMVVDTDAERLMGYECPDYDCCEYVCEHGNPAGPCGGDPCPGPAPVLACADTMGAGVVAAHDGTACGVAAGTRWIEAGAADFADAFACTALIGANSLWQWPMGAMVAAISPELQDAGGCNDGFVRDDAILVVVWLGNEDEPLPGEHPWPSTGDPDSWYQALLDAKGGDAEAVVMLAIAETPSPQIDQVVQMLGDRGFSSSIDGDYAAAFSATIATIALVCEEFEPEG